MEIESSCRTRRFAMGGATAVITATTMEELKQKVEEWYAGAAANGLEGKRIPWDPDKALKTDEGYEFAVWAHT
jgi:hypothetical protein